MPLVLEINASSFPKYKSVRDTQDTNSYNAN